MSSSISEAQTTISFDGQHLRFQGASRIIDSVSNGSDTIYGGMNWSHCPLATQFWVHLLSSPPPAADQGWGCLLKAFLALLYLLLGEAHIGTARKQFCNVGSYIYVASNVEPLVARLINYVPLPIGPSHEAWRDNFSWHTQQTYKGLLGMHSLKNSWILTNLLTCLWLKPGLLHWITASLSFLAPVLTHPPLPGHTTTSPMYNTFLERFPWTSSSPLLGPRVTSVVIDPWQPGYPCHHCPLASTGSELLLPSQPHTNCQSTKYSKRFWV